VGIVAQHFRRRACKLRKPDITKLHQFDKNLVIQDNEMQSVLATLEVITDQGEKSALAAGLTAVSEGKTKTLSEIRAAVKRKK